MAGAIFARSVASVRATDLAMRYASSITRQVWPGSTSYGVVDLGAEPFERLGEGDELGGALQRVAERFQLDPLGADAKPLSASDSLPRQLGLDLLDGFHGRARSLVDLGHGHREHVWFLADPDRVPNEPTLLGPIERCT